MAKRTYSNRAAQGDSKSEIPENGPKRQEVSNGGGDSRQWETLADGVSARRRAKRWEIWPSSGMAGNWNPCDEDVNAQIERAWREGKTVVAVTSGPRHWQYELDLIRLVQLGTFYPETCSGDILVTGPFPTPSYTLYLYPIPYAPPTPYTEALSEHCPIAPHTPHTPYPIPHTPGPGPRAQGPPGCARPQSKVLGHVGAPARSLVSKTQHVPWFSGM